MAQYAILPARGLIRLSGPEARPFLQALISNNVESVRPDRAVYAALLSPQGKYLFDFFVIETGDGLLLDCERERQPELEKKLKLYRLRARVEIGDANAELQVAVLFGDDDDAGLPVEPGAARILDGGAAYVDPRLAELGVRLVLPRDQAAAHLNALGAPATPEDYDCFRLGLGVPDGSRDLEIDKALLLENNFEALHGVDFGKGCYVGQEVTARTKYRGLVRKRLMRVDVDGPLPAPGTPVLLGGKEAGVMRSGRDGIALALIRIEALAEAGGRAFVAGEARVRPVRTAWMEV